MKGFLLLLAILLMHLPGTHLNAQRFQLGVSSEFILSQIEGDQLRGFNKIGYSFGLNGGYAFDHKNWMVVSLNYSLLGSRKASEKASNQSNKILVSSQLRTINTTIAYSRRFGDSWDGTKKYRFIIGGKIHKITDVETFIFNNPISNPSEINDEDFHSTFCSLLAGFGMFLRKDLVFDIQYNHSLKNVLKESELNIVKLAPFYFSFGLNYYIW